MLNDELALTYWRRWHHVVDTCCHRNAVRAHDVPDVKQEVFLRLLVACREGRFDPDTSTSTYLYLVARNVVWSMRATNKDKFRRHAQEFTDQLKPERTTPHHILERKERHEALHRAANKLCGSQRAVFDGLMQGLNHPELVEHLDLNPNTLKTNRKRMTDNLTKLLNP